MTSRTSALSVGVLALTVLLGHLSLFPRVADLDAFYHIGHAFAYAEGGIFNTALPWATMSIISERGADMWWGFHAGLLPFTLVGDVEWAVRLAALVLTATLAVTVLWILTRHNVHGAGWWTVFFLIAVPNIFFRHLMVRPHMMSLAASLALLSLLVRGRPRYVFLASALITWLQLSLFWMGPGIVIAYVMVRYVEAVIGAPKGRESVKPSTAVSLVFLGTVAGWLLRPHPIEAGALANVQIIRLFAQKATQEPLLFAAELLPIPFMEVLQTSWLFLALWFMVCIGTLSYLGKDKLESVPPEERTLLVTSVVISVTFLLLATLSARRAMVQWVAFGCLALPLFWTYAVYVYNRQSVRRFVGAVLAVHMIWGGWRHTLNVNQVAFEADTLQESARYIEDHSEPGEVVFHARWDNFGPLFANNRKNLYIGGMDPIFQFVYEPRFYWEYFYISADINVEWTCDAFPCNAGLATNTYEVLRDHFGARWVVVEPFRNPRFSLYLLNDARYRLAFESQRSAVFEIMDTPEAPDVNVPGAPSDEDPSPPSGNAAASAPGE